MMNLIGTLLGVILILIILIIIGGILLIITGIIGYLIKELTGKENPVSKLSEKIIDA